MQNLKCKKDPEYKSFRLISKNSPSKIFHHTPYIIHHTSYFLLQTSYLCIMEYFNRLLELLKTERQEDREIYKSLIESSSVTDRRASGITWYPIAIKDTEISRGDYLTVEIERTTHQDLPHQLRSGASAILFSQHDAKQDRIEGTINWQYGNRLKITIYSDELPEWSRNGKLGIDLLFDENSYDEMQSALTLAIKLSEKEKDAHTINILTGKKPATFHFQSIPEFIPSLNPSQQIAIDKVLSANDLAIVHGPPGTGKTTVLVQAIKSLVKRHEKKILVVAPSNTAVDLLGEKLSEEGLNVLRVGNPARVSERLLSLTLDYKMSEHASMKEVKKMKKQAAEYINMAHKYKRNFGKAEREQRRALFDEAHSILKATDNTEQYISRDIIDRAQVITATLVGANHYTVRHLHYDTVVIDEAGQALEPACWISILKARKVIMAGDHHQLPPTIKSIAAANGGLSNTLLEKCVRLHPESVVLLEEQYRM